MDYKRNKNMPGFENKPYSKDDYDKNTEDAENLKKQMVGAKTADEMMAIAMKMKAAEGNEKELMGNAQEEAGKENEERKVYDEAVAEDSERKMYDEAKAEDAERTTAKETDKMDADLENLKGQIVGAKNADEMMEIAGKIKEIEEKKKEIGAGSQKEESEKREKELEELKLKDETESGKKVEEILKKLNGSNQESGNVEKEAPKTAWETLGVDKNTAEKLLLSDELTSVRREADWNDEDYKKEYDTKVIDNRLLRKKIEDNLMSKVGDGTIAEEEKALLVKNIAEQAKYFHWSGFLYGGNEKGTKTLRNDKDVIKAIGASSSRLDNKQWAQSRAKELGFDLNA